MKTSTRASRRFAALKRSREIRHACLAIEAARAARIVGMNLEPLAGLQTAIPLTARSARHETGTMKRPSS